MKKLNRSAMFTDIHFGRKNNSEMHNQDCLDFIKWFVKKVEEHDCDHVAFLGDWHEQRSAISSLTLDYSYRGAELLDSLGIPIIIIVGNHDLHYRNNRDIYTTKIFEPFKNIVLIDKPTPIEHVGVNGTLFSPFLFEHEYPSLLQYSDIPVWMGHFEFKGFVITGETKKMEHGPDPKDFKKPKRIFTGHFHKRQESGNVHYIGNTFPADYSDANDNARGMAVYDHKDDKLEYHDWPDCPTYIKKELSYIVKNHKKILKKGARVWSLADIDLDYDSIIELKEKLVTNYELREFNIDEPTLTEELEEGDMDISDLEMEDINSVVLELLGRIESDNIENDKLRKIYKEL